MSAPGNWLADFSVADNRAVPDGLVPVQGYDKIGRLAEEVAIMEKAETVEDSDCETAPEVEAATAAAEEAKAALAAATSVKKPKGLTVKRVETCDPTVIAEAIVPREYLSVDLKKVREAFKAGVRDIPGIDLGIKTETRTIAR